MSYARGRRLLMISGVRWNYLWQRHQALARAAAENGWIVDFLEPHPRSIHQVAVFLRRLLAGPAGKGNRNPVVPGVTVLPWTRWLRRSAEQYDVVLCYVPSVLAERRIRKTPASAVVYDAVIDWERAPPEWYAPRRWREAEHRIASLVTAVTITDSRGMQEVLRRRGIAAGLVEPAVDPEFLFVDLVDDPAPSAVYFGSARSEIDYAALAALVNAGVPVDVIGTVATEQDRAALQATGASLHPPMESQSLARAVSRYALVLLPYTGPRAATLAPAKLWNSLATGRWVLVSGLEVTVEAANLVQARDAQDIARLAIGLLRKGPPASKGSFPSWDDRWQEVLSAARLPDRDVGGRAGSTPIGSGD